MCLHKKFLILSLALTLVGTAQAADCRKEYQYELNGMSYQDEEDRTSMALAAGSITTAPAALIVGTFYVRRAAKRKDIKRVVAILNEAPLEGGLVLGRIYRELKARHPGLAYADVVAAAQTAERTNAFCQNNDLYTFNEAVEWIEVYVTTNRS